MLPNTVPGSSGPINLSINGSDTRVFQKVDPRLLARAEDVTLGIIVGSPRQGPRPMDESRGIPVMSDGNEADLSLFLSDGMSEWNTDIDMVMICLAAEGPGAITAEGIQQVDNLTETQLGWLSSSLAQNTVSGVANEGGNIALFAREVSQSSRGQVIAALKEVIWQGRFHVKPIASWGGKMAIIFKGAHRSRSFLTAISYGLNNGKMTYISSYAEVAAPGVSIAGRAAAAASAASKGNFIGFAIAAAFDVNDFITTEDPEQNWSGLLGALGVTFVKVWIAGFVGILAGVVVIGIAAAAPVALVVGIGLSVSIFVGYKLDQLDNWLGVKDKAKKIGNAFAGAASRGLRAVSAFVQKIVTSGKGIVDGWFDEFQKKLQRSDPTGWCALFCSNPIDLVNAWHRMFGAPGGIQVPGR
ncbi:hypothetical protein [Paracoccus aminophilus]|nr:hypothetical protein [Paracoccus aminophilus]